MRSPADVRPHATHRASQHRNRPRRDPHHRVGGNLPVPRTNRSRARTDLTKPHLLDGGVADVIVRVRGSSACSGTPIAGTPLVITAAHCVLDEEGDLTVVSVLRDGVEHAPVRPVERPVPRRTQPRTGRRGVGDGPNDPGRGCDARRRPAHADPCDGCRLPAHRHRRHVAARHGYDNRPTPKGVTGGVIEISPFRPGAWTARRRSRSPSTSTRLAAVSSQVLQAVDYSSTGTASRPGRHHLDGRFRPLIQRADTTRGGARAVEPSCRVHTRAPEERPSARHAGGLASDLNRLPRRAIELGTVRPGSPKGRRRPLGARPDRR